MTAQSEAMKKIVAPVHVALKERGFRRRGNGFNREVEPGTVQIIRFQMGRFDPPGTVEIPGLRYNLYGLFTVNVAIYLDAIRAQQGFPATRPAFVDEGGSHLRQRLGELMDPPGDCWWSLDNPDEVGPLVHDLVLDIGLTWLESLSSQDQILTALEAAPPGSRSVSGLADRLLAMRLRIVRGETAQAQDNLTAWIHSCDLPADHLAYLARIAAEHGLSMDAAP